MLHQGKDKPETCSGGNGNQGDGTALSFHEPAHNGEPQAQTTGPRRPETLKNGFRPFGRNARPHVMNIQPNLAARGVGTTLQRNRGSLRSMYAGIQQQIDQYLFHQGKIRLHQRIVRRQDQSIDLRLYSGVLPW